jgi:hypothetical protein
VDVELAVLDDELVQALRARVPAATMANAPIAGRNLLLPDASATGWLSPGDLRVRWGREPRDMMALLHFIVTSNGMSRLQIGAILG